MQIHLTNEALAADARRLCLVAWCLPRPVRCVEVKADEKRLARFGVAVNHLHRAGPPQTAPWRIRPGVDERDRPTDRRHRRCPCAQLVYRATAEAPKVVVAALEPGRILATRPGAICRRALCHNPPSARATAMSGALSATPGRDCARAVLPDRHGPDTDTGPVISPTREAVHTAEFDKPGRSASPWQRYGRCWAC